SGEKLNGVGTPGVKGRYTVEQGLRTLLSGTGLSFKPAGEGTVSLSQTSWGGSTQNPIFLAQAPNQDADASEGQPRATAPRAAQSRETVVVTGTNIRGIGNPTVPLTSFDR